MVLDRRKVNVAVHAVAWASVAAVAAFVLGTALGSDPTVERSTSIEYELVESAQASPFETPGVDSAEIAQANPSMVVISRTGEPVPAFRSPDVAAEPWLHVPAGPNGESTFLAVRPFGDLESDWSTLTRDGEWIEVLLPVRPNGSTGWIKLADTELFRNSFRVEIDRQRFSIHIYENDQLILQSKVAIGTGDTPTPQGRFFTTELIQTVYPKGPYGPYAFAISGYSETIFDFNGGPGIIGVHGTNDPSGLGTEVSFGCVRVSNDVIEYMAKTLPLGTPVEIA